MIIVFTIIAVLSLATFALLKAASNADRHAELMRDFEEEK